MSDLGTLLRQARRAPLVDLSLAACALPALQAMRVAPAIVLRDEV